MNKLFSTNLVLQNGGLTAIRIIIGCFLIDHGWEIFDRNKLNEYMSWDVFKTSSFSPFMIYMGKTAELIAGFLLTLGLFTRISSIIIMGTFFYIPFFVGSGK